MVLACSPVTGDSETTGAIGEASTGDGESTDASTTGGPADPGAIFASSYRVTPARVRSASDGDSLCRQWALRAHPGGVWRPMPGWRSFTAWLSDASSAAVDRARFDGPYARFDGQLVATDLGSLARGELLAPVLLDEHGRGAGHGAWTGTGPGGRATGSDCLGWVSDSPGELGTAGLPWATDAAWAFGPAVACDQALRLYCVGAPGPADHECGDGVVQIPIEDCDGGPGCTACMRDRLVFVTSVAYLPTEIGGVDGADHECARLAREAGRAGWDSTRSWLASGREPAGAAHGLSPGAYVRVDGDRVVASGRDLVAGDGLASPVSLDETGALVSALAWTGAGGIDCDGWTSDDPSAFGGVGMTFAADGRWADAATSACDQRRRLYCIEFAVVE